MLIFQGLYCNACSYPIRLPSPTHPGKPLDRPLWPKDGQTRNFLCPQCKQVCAYSSQDAHWIRADDMAPSLDRKRHSVVCVEVSCGTPNCEAPIKIHVLMASNADPVAEAPRILQLSKTDRIACGRVHFLEGSLQNVQILDAYFDEDWGTW